MSFVKLNIVRGNPATERKFVAYKIPFVEGMSLLDGIFWIREHVDPSVSVRYSCRSANACKECMASVDGKPGYLCSIRAVEDTEVNIEPLSKRPWISDLATDIE